MIISYGGYVTAGTSGPTWNFIHQNTVNSSKDRWDACIFFGQLVCSLCSLVWDYATILAHIDHFFSFKIWVKELPSHWIMQIIVSFQCEFFKLFFHVIMFSILQSLNKNDTILRSILCFSYPHRSNFRCHNFIINPWTLIGYRQTNFDQQGQAWTISVFLILSQVQILIISTYSSTFSTTY